MDSAAIRTELKRLPVLDMTRGLTGGVLTLVSSTALVVIFVLFMLAGKSDGSHANALTAEISGQVTPVLSDVRRLPKLMRALTEAGGPISCTPVDSSITSPRGS